VLLRLEAVAVDGPPKVLDLAGGTGTIALRTLARFRDAQVTVVDQDPVLLALAGASLDGRAGIIVADLGHPSWTEALPHHAYDAVLTATALHWLDPDRLAVLYGEIRGVLRAGGVFANADHMPDEGLPELTKRLIGRADARREVNARLEPLRPAEEEEVTAATPDDFVLERAARQRAAAERRVGLELDRAGRFAESRVRMRLSEDFLAGAPMTAEVQADLAETRMLASAPPTRAYGSHTRKSAQLRESLRRRGRQGFEPESPVEGR